MNRIKTKKELNFYLQADMMMNRGRFKKGFYGYLKDVLSPDSIMTFLRMMRKYSYYSFTPPVTCHLKFLSQNIERLLSFSL